MNPDTIISNVIAQYSDLDDEFIKSSLKKYKETMYDQEKTHIAVRLFQYLKENNLLRRDKQ